MSPLTATTRGRCQTPQRSDTKTADVRSFAKKTSSSTKTIGMYSRNEIPKTCSPLAGCVTAEA